MGHSADRWQWHDDLGGVGRTGFYLSEAAHPWHVFRQAGYQVDLVSPQGGEPPRDGVDISDPLQQAFLDDAEMSRKLTSTLHPDEVDPHDYAAILYAGGHGSMWDFPHDTGLARIARDIYEAGGVVAAVCHGPAGLVNITLSDGSYLVAGQEVSAFTNDEESAVGLTGVVPFLLQTALEERGAKHMGAANFQPHVSVADRLVTGQNPASATGVADQVVKILTQNP
ncbi:MAG TPA: type 1 glutamine amidotransferase domain-containing protein [Streptosporangiaceae bacterium]|nr:type 1 glutamine amidotransferase domain-containing protein [Streptosporangiaceae bacterium]